MEYRRTRHIYTACTNPDTAHSPQTTRLGHPVRDVWRRPENTTDSSPSLQNCVRNQWGIEGLEICLFWEQSDNMCLPLDATGFVVASQFVVLCARTDTALSDMGQVYSAPTAVPVIDKTCRLCWFHIISSLEVSASEYLLIPYVCTNIPPPKNFLT
jgi:hypothetical protein